MTNRQRIAAAGVVAVLAAGTATAFVVSRQPDTGEQQRTTDAVAARQTSAAGQPQARTGAPSSASTTAASGAAPGAPSTTTPGQPTASAPGSAGPAGAPTPSRLPPAPRGTFDSAKASTMLKSVVAVTTPRARTSAETTATFAPLTAGTFLAEINAEQGELRENGWTKRGSATVVDLKVVSQQGKKATVSACLNQAGVSVLDARGRPIGPASVPRARHLYDFAQQPDGSWRIIAHRFPDNPSC